MDPVDARGWLLVVDDEPALTNLLKLLLQRSGFQVATSLDLSARSYMRLIKVARTIADIDDRDELTSKHLAEALHYREPSQRSSF